MGIRAYVEWPIVDYLYLNVIDPVEPSLGGYIPEHDTLTRRESMQTSIVILDVRKGLKIGCRRTI